MLSILVTGAAGLIGGEVCARLASAGHRVYALTHRAPDIFANDGSRVPVAAALNGDICAAGLGLHEAPQVDVVIHCAASLTFDAPYDALEAINVGGTRNVIAFAKAHNAALIHVSTAYVCGLQDGPIAEKPVADGTVFANGYERSKAQAEKQVHGSGLTHCIVRPAIVLGDSKTGAIRKFDAMYQTFAMITRGWVDQLPTTPEASLDFVPVDYVAQAIAQLAQRMDAANGSICHLTSGNPLALESFAQAISAYPQFSTPNLVSAASFDTASLSSSQRRVWHKVASAYASYFQRNPRFVNANLRTLTGLETPETGAQWFHRLIEFAIDGGLLAGAAPNAHPDTDRQAACAHQEPTASLP